MSIDNVAVKDQPFSIGEVFQESDERGSVKGSGAEVNVACDDGVHRLTAVSME